MIIVAAAIGSALLAAMLAVAVHDGIRRPGFRRLALRNLVRRRTETILVVIGSSLGTAIIAAAFLIGATFHASVRDGARTRLGPIDEEVAVADIADVDGVARRLATPPLPGGDGVLAAERATVSVTTRRNGRTVSEPAARILEVDPARARDFGGDVAATGLGSMPARLGTGEVAIGSDLAGTIGARAGDTITLHAYGTSRDFRVVRVLPRVGIAGSTDVLAAPGVLDSMVRQRGPTPGVEPPQGIVFVSNAGGVFGGADASSKVAAAIRSRVGSRYDIEVTSVKADLLADAERQGHAMGQLFTGVGTFSVLAGLLLLVNLFVMMAEERKRELGLARATGLQRWHLIRVFTLEGLFYGVAASFVGCFLGAGVAWGVVATASHLVGHGSNAFALRLVVPTGVLIVAGLIGLGLSMATVWVTSFRIARLNIVRALRDLPEMARRRHELRSAVPAGVGVATGVALSIWGLLAIVPLAAVLGPPLALVSAIPLLRPIIGRRLTTAVASVGTLVWCVGVFTFVPRIASHTRIPVFVVQGIVMVAAAVGLATALDRAWAVGVGMISRTGRGLAARLGLAYPLEKVFRTGMLVGMYALIVFTLTFVAVYGQISANQASTITRQVAAGADVLVDANPSNPPGAAKLDAVPGVAGVRTVWRSAPRFTPVGWTYPTTWAASAYDASMLTWGVPHLTDRAASYTSDRAVFEALLADPGLIVIGQRFLETGGVSSSAGSTLQLGSRIVASDPATGRTRTYRVVGITGDDVAGAGSWMSLASMRSLSGAGAVPSRFLVRVAPGHDPDQVAASLQNDLVVNGVQAATFASKVSDSMTVELGFLNLMRRYMAIGLIVGIAGMAVVMVRAGRARRRQIGMLRVIGFPPETVRGAFLVEAAFIAGQGIATGVGLGLLVSYQMLSRSAALGGDVLPYAVPWSTVATLAVLPFVASLLVAFVPAMQASSVEPAQVLRMVD